MIHARLSGPGRWPFMGLGALALALLMPLASCDRHRDGDGHDHGTGARGGDSGPHGHAHGAGAEHADEVTLTAEAVERHGVRIGEAQLWVLRPTFVAPARVGFNAEAMAHVGSPLRGRVVEIHARLGDSVRAGDPLIVVESPELGQAQTDYVLKRAAAEAAAPQVDLARAAWDRARNLFEQSQGISLTEVQKREAEYKAALAGLRSAEATAVAAENALHLLGMDQPAVEALAKTGEIAPRSTIRAAIGGRVVQREVTLGELVGPDRDALLVLADTGILWVLADVPEARLQSIAVGAAAWVVAGPGAAHRYEGVVGYIAPFVDPITRTAEVRVEVPSVHLGDGAVRPGMFAEVEIVAPGPGGADPAPVVAVPAEAVHIVEGGPAVFVPVPGEPNTFARRAVTVGAPVGGLVPVYGGLVEGEAFVDAGAFILKAELGKGSAGHDH